MMRNLENNRLVGVRGDKIVIMLPLSVMSKEEALVFAAWIVTLADDNDEFPKILEEVRNT